MRLRVERARASSPKFTCRPAAKANLMTSGLLCSQTRPSLFCSNPQSAVSFTTALPAAHPAPALAPAIATSPPPPSPQRPYTRRSRRLRAPHGASSQGRQVPTPERQQWQSPPALPERLRVQRRPQQPHGQRRPGCFSTPALLRLSACLPRASADHLPRSQRSPSPTMRRKRQTL